MSPTIIILAGPNGAGTTTFARSFLPQEANCLRFINADLIAAGLSPFAPEAEALKAGRLMLQEIDNCVKQKKRFAFETTLSGLGYLSGPHSRVAIHWIQNQPLLSGITESKNSHPARCCARETGRAQHPEGCQPETLYRRLTQLRGLV
jgi:hypothetical protein